MSTWAKVKGFGPDHEVRPPGAGAGGRARASRAAGRRSARRRTARTGRPRSPRSRPGLLALQGRASRGRCPLSGPGAHPSSPSGWAESRSTRLVIHGLVRPPADLGQQPPHQPGQGLVHAQTPHPVRCRPQDLGGLDDQRPVDRPPRHVVLPRDVGARPQRTSGAGTPAPGRPSGADPTARPRPDSILVCAPVIRPGPVREQLIKVLPVRPAPPQGEPSREVGLRERC